jgi:hypothetical protein
MEIVMEKSFLLIVVISMGIVFSGCGRGFPSNKEIDAMIVKYSESKHSDRFVIITSLLTRIKSPKSATDDSTVQYAVDKLVEVYLETNDPEILEAVDLTPIDGGFANYICEFYKSIKSTKSFAERYRINSAEPLKRCVGISFTKDEFEKILARE